MDQLLPFALFAFVASITPGPTNILVLSHSSRFGLTTTWPIILGACAAAALLVLVVGTGLGTCWPGTRRSRQCCPGPASPG